MTTSNKKTSSGDRRGLQGRPLRFHEGNFVLDVRSGMFYRMTSSATYLLKAWSEGAQISTFPDLIRQQFGVDAATASRDVELMLNQFRGLGLIDAESAEARP